MSSAWPVIIFSAASKDPLNGVPSVATFRTRFPPDASTYPAMMSPPMEWPTRSTFPLAAVYPAAW